jgi:hypothetical protein
MLTAIAVTAAVVGTAFNTYATRQALAASRKAQHDAEFALTECREALARIADAIERAIATRE